jgi:UDP:flavonoid glycosyltransferase YjiC (YdhE family)
MRVLFGSWPGHGHLLPMAPLIRAAQQGGHDVAVSSGADMSGLIGRLGVRAHASGRTLAESYARMPEHVTISELPRDEQPAFAAVLTADAVVDEILPAMTAPEAVER